MAFPSRVRPIPQCTACLGNYAWARFADVAAPTQTTGLRQQVRGKKKLARPTGNIPARLLKDLPGFGKKGAIVPMARGQMRNNYFPSRTAEYVTMPELRTLRSQNVPIERDYMFGKKDPSSAADGPLLMPLRDEPTPLPVRRGPEVEKLTTERSVQLLEIFVPHRIDFYRQPIVEEIKEEKADVAPKKEQKRQRTASSAAADLLAARTQKPLEKPQPKFTGAIYGSVSQHDILVAVRAAIATNDEAARVIVTEQDIEFLNEPARTEHKIKELGDSTIEIKVKGEENGVKRTVRVIPQEA
ncbi:putative ribosomal protein L9 [Septoria linicola]|nr:putative ribosomal protein L9 [Septoria linicola]